MRKITIFSLLVVFSLASFAQRSNSIVAKQAQLLKSKQVKVQNPTTLKAAGDVAFEDDFSDASKWTCTALNGPLNWEIDDKDGVLASTLVHYIGGNDNFEGNIAMYTAINYYTDDTLIATDPIEASMTLNDPIDLSSYANLAISWDQKYKAWNSDQVFLEYSLDGSTWLALGGAELFAAYNVTEYVPSPQYNVSTELGGQATVYLRFRYIEAGGTGYGLMIDNLKIIEVGANDMVIEESIVDFMNADEGYYHQIPLAVAGETKIAFRTPVLNFGYADQTGVKLGVTVTKDGTEVIYDKVGPAKNIATTLRDTLQLGIDLLADPATWTDSLLNGVPELGIYTIDMEVTADEDDQSILDNTTESEFTVSWDRFSRNNGVYTGRTAPGSWVGGDADGSAIGIVYTVPVKSIARGISVYISPRSSVGEMMAVLSTYDGTDWVPVLYSDESREITMLDTATWVDIYFPEDGATEVIGPDAGSDPIQYMISLEFYNADDDGMWIGEDVSTKSPNWATQWNFGDGYQGIGNYTKSPMMNFIMKPYIMDVNDVVATSAIKLFPNPSTGIINIANVENANVTVYNILGDAVMTFSNVSKSVNVSDLSNGTYIVKVQSNNAITTQKISLIK